MAVNKDGFSRSLPEVCFPWKACDRQNRFASSNLALSAGLRGRFLMINRSQEPSPLFPAYHLKSNQRARSK